MTIAEQLTRNYYLFEFWHTEWMPWNIALKYHEDRLKNGEIYVCQENGEVRGYWERTFEGKTCFLKNIWIKPGYRGTWVMEDLKREFFSTMPKGITKIKGEKQKIGGKIVERMILHGND